MGYSRLIIFLLSATLLLSSCATLSGSGVGRVKHYSVESSRLPESFDGLRVAFVSDLHYPSKFTRKRLVKLCRMLGEIDAEVLAIGGDFVPSAQYVAPLFSAFSSLKTAYGKYAVPGNHDYEFYDTLHAEGRRCGIKMLADSAVCISNGIDSICVAGVYDSFAVGSSSEAMLAGLDKNLFTILLSHTPDFAQDSSVECDLVLSGHTHGGQVNLLGLYTPVKNTKYGTRFLRGKNSTDNGTVVITTNGVGTSRCKVRFCVPSEIVVITLKRSASAVE